MRKIILVGQAPSRRSDPKEPFSGSSGRRLAALAGMEHGAFLAEFERVNLLSAPQAKAGKGDKFDIEAARAKADALRLKWSGRKSVLLGRGVALAFRLVPDDYAWFRPIEIPPGVEVAVMPHPSGISHWWNDSANVEAAREFMQRVKLGFFSLPRLKEKTAPNGRPEKFLPEQVGAALVAADGIMLRASELLAEETGRSCDRDTIANYCERYPGLMELRERCRQAVGDIAERNVLAEVRRGNPDLSLRLLRSKAFIGRGYELAVHQRTDGRIEHEHLHRHAHLHARLGEIGLDLSRYSDEQLDAIEEFAGMIEGPKRNG